MHRLCSLALVLLAACGGAPASPDGSTGDATTTSPTSSSEASGTTESTPTTTATTADETTHGDPVCCGCLCVDPSWSCAADTCVYPDGTAAALAPEAGFLAIAAHTFSTYKLGEETVHAAPEARMWYAFRPADDDPIDKPLAVFFNGGPGYSSAALFGANTNAITLDPDVAGDAVLADNPARWTRFANVLYIDPRGAGYSYDVAPGVADVAPLKFAPEHDAADYVRTILAFLGRHPQIRGNRVILVSESYGGNRSALMIGQFMRPAQLLKTTRYRDETTHAELLAHYAAVFPAESQANDLTPVLLARQFGHQVMIQPALTWLDVPGVVDTPDDKQMLELGCVGDPDYLQCDEPNGWAGARTGAIIAALTAPTHLTSALGVDATTIEWLRADARADAVPRGANKSAHDEAGLRAVFGELPDGESYYYPYTSPYLDSIFDWEDRTYGYTFLASFIDVETFVTDAGKDLTVHAPDIPKKIAGYPDVVADVIHNKEPFADEPRPGRLIIQYTPGLIPGDPNIVLRHPYYPSGGHIITLKHGGELADDVCRWFSEDCPLP